MRHRPLAPAVRGPGAAPVPGRGGPAGAAVLPSGWRSKCDTPRHALLQHHRPRSCGRPLLHPAVVAAGPRCDPRPRQGQAVLRAARAAPDRQDLRAPRAEGPAERRRRGRCALRVRERRGRTGAARGRAKARCAPSSTRWSSRPARRWATSRWRVSGPAFWREPDRATHCGASWRGGPSRTRDPWCCSSTRSTPSSVTRCSRCSASFGRDTTSARRAFPRASCCAGCATCATTASIRAPRRRSSPVAARSTSRRGRCAWAISRQRRWTRLLAQHTEDTGQAFSPESLETIRTQTQGQPWRVNALASEACFWNEAGPRPESGDHRGRHLRGPRAAHRAPRDPPRPARRQAPGGPRPARRRAAPERWRGERDLGVRPRCTCAIWG